MPERNQWYTNKDLFEQINAMQSEFKDFRAEMKETRTMIRQYNGLREELAKVEKKVNDMESRSKGRNAVGKAIREWGGWLVAIVTFILMFL